MSSTDSPRDGSGWPPGGWPSPLSASAIAAGAGALTELRACDGTLYWLESRPRESGRTTLLRADDAGVHEVTPAPINVRSRVHEYGGGAYLPTRDGVFFVDDRDGDVHHLAADGTRRRLTDGRGAMRFADFAYDPRRQRVLAVCERQAPGEPENLIVAIPLHDGPEGPQPLVTLHRGHDFYAAPRLSPDGTALAFVAWDHPNMPWDGSLLKLARLDDEGRTTDETVVAGSAAEAVQQPVWTDPDGLVFASDVDGYWNLYRYDASGVHCLLQDGAEYAEAPWQLGSSTIAPVGGAWLAGVRFADGAGELVLIDGARGFAAPLTAQWLECESLCAIPGAVAFIGRSADAPAAVVVRSLADGTERVIARAWLPDLPARVIARAEPRTFRARDGAIIHALLYRPQNPDCALAPDDRPPLLVSVHGGPTARSSAALHLRTQYFTSRGWAVLEVDYRGSTGYGRRYREALNGRWGDLDVADCEDATAALLHEGLVDGRRVALRGSSAGGLTVLAALAGSRLFGAGTSLYGIGDLAALARDTHKFESRYVRSLVGDDAACARRSPIHQADRIQSPVLFLQGADDRVVPPAQADGMAAALRARRVPFAYVLFAGEGHGFRQASSVERALECEYAFYCRVFGIEPATPLPPLEIEYP
jgi:dipeptidyl aminopeptidase/acylaminoacyl peptidase